jgi:hypothetical protein
LSRDYCCDDVCEVVESAATAMGTVTSRRELQVVDCGKRGKLFTLQYEPGEINFLRPTLNSISAGYAYLVHNTQMDVCNQIPK